MLTEFGGGSQFNPLIEMLLLQTFCVLKDNLWRVESKRRLPKALATILKPKTIEDCPGLNVYAIEVLIHVNDNCLSYMAQELIKTCAGLLKTVTRINEANQFFGMHTGMSDQDKKDLAARFRIAETKATALVNILCDSIKTWVRLKKQSL